MEDKSLIELRLEDIPELSPQAIKKLKEAEILTVTDLAVESVEELALKLNINNQKSGEFISAAQKLLRSSGALNKEFMTGMENLELRKKIERLTTSSTSLDNLLHGGIETQAITEFYGAFTSGKSQICHQLAINATLPSEKGGLNGNVLYVDTEGAFRSERIAQICQERGLNHEEILSKIYVNQPISTSVFEFLIDSISHFIDKYDVRLLVIDSIINLHRAEYQARGTLATRQQKLNNMLHKVWRVSRVNNIAVVITNQVTSNPDSMGYGSPTKATGGNIIGHTATYRIQLRKGEKTKRIASMKDSPSHPDTECVFQITESGVHDVEKD